MNWKLIWKYTGKLFAATIFVWFSAGLLSGIFYRAGTLLSSGLIIYAALATLAIVIFVFAKLSLEQRESANLHALAVFLLCALIPLPFNVILFEQSLLEWTLGSVIFLGAAAAGVGGGTFLSRPRRLKSEANVPHSADIKNIDARIKIDEIQICQRCCAKNRLHQAVLIDLKPVCGKCGNALEKSTRSASDFGDYNFGDFGYGDFEYVDVEPERRNENPKIHTYPSSPRQENRVFDIRYSAAAPSPQIIHAADGTEQADEKLKNDFINRLSKDREKAFRIVESLRRRHAGRSERWCWEKAIEDLEHDNR